MPSQIKVDQIAGASGNTVTVPSGQTLDISSATLSLPSTVVTTTGTQTLTNKTIGVSQLTGTLPVANGGTGLTSLGSASQVLRVNSGATALEFATPSSGKILQVVHTRVTTLANTNSTSQVASGVLATITPTSASSTILIIGNLASVRVSNGSWGEISLRRKIGAGSYTNFGNYEGGYAYDGHGVHNFGYGFSYLDSPATTSQLTYEIFFAKAGAGTFVKINDDSPIGSQFNFLEIGA